MRGFSGKQLTGLFITGAALGVAAGLILAPKTGAQTRKDIRRISKRAVGQLDDLQSDIREQLTDGYQQVKRILKTA